VTRLNRVALCSNAVHHWVGLKAFKRPRYAQIINKRLFQYFIGENVSYRTILSKTIIQGGA
jgi:hypothetical protein